MRRIGKKQKIQTAIETPFDNNINEFASEEVQSAIEESSTGKHLKNCKNKIHVCKNGNDSTGDGTHHNPYKTICHALTQITDNDENNRYAILVGPGEFVEDTVVMKQYVSIIGQDAQVTVIDVDTPTKSVIVGSVSSSLVKVTISGASGIGGNGIFCENVTGTFGEPFIVHSCLFLDNETHLKVDGAAGTIGLQVNFCRFDPSFTNGIVATTANDNDAYLYLSNLSLFHRGLSVGDFMYLAGSGIKAFLGSVSCTNTSLSGTGIRMRDGAKLVATASALEGFDKGLWIEDVGANCSIYGDFKLVDNVTYDIQIDQATAWGNITGVAQFAKVSNAAISTMSLNYVDPVTGDFNVSRVTHTRGLSTDIKEIIASEGTYTLTKDCPYALDIEGTTSGQIIELPDATTLRKGHQFLIINESTQLIDIKLYDDIESISVFSKGTAKYILRDNSTTTGLWSRSISSSSPFQGTAPVVCGYGANAGTGRYLEFWNGNSSDTSPFVAITGFNIVGMSMGGTAPSTCTIAIFKNGDFVNQLGSLSTDNQTNTYRSDLNIPLTIGDLVTIRVVSGSINKPFVAMYLAGTG